MTDKTVITPHDPERVHLVQLTDPHIFGDAEARFDGVDTSATLGTVVTAVNALAESPDAVLMTGDLVHEPEPGAYDRLARHLQDLHAPVFCLPGNHDDPALMHARLNMDGISTRRLVAIGDWLVILLDTWQRGTHAGRLSAAELNFLRDSLETSGRRAVLIALHHPPVSIGSPWMDAMGLENPQKLFAVLDAYPSVRGVLWGHIHQEFYQCRYGVDMYGTPSTCVQFRPGADHYVRHELPPGFRELFLRGDGSIDSGVRRCPVQHS
jgi:Icc protein